MNDSKKKAQELLLDKDKELEKIKLIKTDIEGKFNSL